MPKLPLKAYDPNFFYSPIIQCRVFLLKETNSALLY